MRKVFITFLCLMLAGFCACGSIKPEETATATTVPEEAANATNTEQDTNSSVTISTSNNNASEITAYSDIVMKVIEEYKNAPDQLKEVYYFLYDIDRNGTIELLFGSEWGENIYITAVYSIQKGVAVRQEEYSVDVRYISLSMLFENGTIKTGYGGKGGEMALNYLCFENEKLKLKNGLGENYGVYNHYDYDSKIDTAITKEEFERLEKFFEGDGRMIELDWKPLEEYGR